MEGGQRPDDIPARTLSLEVMWLCVIALRQYGVSLLSKPHKVFVLCIPPLSRQKIGELKVESLILIGKPTFIHSVRLSSGLAA